MRLSTSRDVRMYRTSDLCRKRECSQKQVGNYRAVARIRKVPRRRASMAACAISIDFSDPNFPGPRISLTIIPAGQHAGPGAQ